MNLRSYQEELKKLIFPHEPEATDSVLWGEQLPERLEVYRNNSRSNWSDTLDHDFELTRSQFEPETWNDLRRHFFLKHPPQHWELNTSMEPFVKFFGTQKVQLYVKELADYEWNDLKIFIDRAEVKPSFPRKRESSSMDSTPAFAGVTPRPNPTLRVRVYQHQILDWVMRKAPKDKPPKQKPEVLVFYRDSKNTCAIQEADPLMLLFIEHFKKSGAVLSDLEPVRRKLLPQNNVPLENVFAELQKNQILL